MAWPFSKALRIKGKLDRAEVDRLINQLDFQSQCHERLLPSSRRQKRCPYRVPAISMVLTQNGQDATLIVSGRNLSTNGLGFLLAGPVPEGTACRVRLVDAQGQEEDVDAVVAHCRAAKGDLHSVGVKFTRSIDLERFTPKSR
ncbi:MAG TPA: PilZ domain-containing protein [Phycisphaerae bacterium]|nr:PilZ domain-containing protein [Phycisphaerae bacterium]